MLAIFRKEIRSFFGNWSAWFVFAVISIAGALFLFFFNNASNIFDIGSASLQSYFSLLPWLYMFLLPALAMRSFAEEQQAGTLQWLFSQPVALPDIIFGKFFAVWLLGILSALPSLVYLFTVWQLGLPAGNLDIGAAVGSYTGVLFLAAAFSAAGLFASAISSNQVMAYLVAVSLSFILFFGIEQMASYKLLGGADYWLQHSGLFYHYNSFSRGLIDFGDVAFFILMTGLLILLTFIFIKKKKA